MRGKVRAHIVVSGKVHGVYYRQNAVEQAQKFGLSGWVKNLNNGKVEAVIEGEKENVEKMVAWARKGPFLARVSGLKVEWQEYKGEFNDFAIRY
jgi:acylphosphatase